MLCILYLIRQFVLIFSGVTEYKTPYGPVSRGIVTNGVLIDRKEGFCHRVILRLCDKTPCRSILND